LIKKEAVMVSRQCLPVPGDDGTRLSTDVYLPGGSGAFPVVVFRTPYHRKGWGSAEAHTDRGYAVVAQDCRGKYDSEGSFEPIVDEQRDGQALLRWVSEQGWCNGRIALAGISYMGIVQAPAAAGGHPGLRCMTPGLTPISFFRDWLRIDGCFTGALTLRWGLAHATCRTQPALAHVDWQSLYGLSRLEDIEDRIGIKAPAIRVWAEHDSYDGYWRGVDQGHMHSDVRIPSLHVAGWWDQFQRGPIWAFQNLRRRAATKRARDEQRLFVGPWGHGMTANLEGGECRFGEWAFGPDAAHPPADYQFQLFDYYLKDRDNGFTAQPRVKVFLMGANRWISLEDWPPPGTTRKRWYLHSNGSANMRTGDGRLAEEAPVQSATDGFFYDPADPVPTRGGQLWGGESEHLGPVDQRPLLDRPDVLYYRSEKLERSLTVAGNIELELFAASSAEDTDFTAKLCVEESSGSIIALTLGALRCRYRNSWSDPEALTPGVPVRLGIQMNHTAFVFPAGSRIGLLVTSSDCPRIFPHPNTLSVPLTEETPRGAENTILHGANHPSCLELPVVEGV
jgi:putative CocE/NonD family hydrolase